MPSTPRPNGAEPSGPAVPLPRHRCPARPWARPTIAAVALVLLTSCTGGGAEESRAPAEPVPTSQAPTSRTSTSRAPSTTVGSWARPSDDPLVEEMTSELLASQERVPTPFALAEPQARCLSSSLVRRVGLETLARVGGQLAPAGLVDLTALSVPERQRFANALMSCLDLPQLLGSQLQGIEGLTPDGLRCVVGELTSDGTISRLVRRSIVEGTDLTGQQAALAAPMDDAFDACLPEEEVARLREAGSGRAGGSTSTTMS
ncbi:MAG: hypothetical protein GEV08_14590 [Acidimicrobiia bacterium]|nr:hypothetical protein [Acidimicrobiia bacterium]